MSGKINLYAPFPGVKDGLTLCTLLLDKKKLKEVLGVVKILDARITEVNEAIEVLGKANQMDRLLREAKQQDEEALFALGEAKKNAGEIQKDARSWAEDLRLKIVEREAKAAAREKILAEGEARLKADVERWKKDADKFEVAAVEREKTTVRLLEEAQGLKKRYEAALASMKAGVAAA
jgi:hypothetical protein